MDADGLATQGARPSTDGLATQEYLLCWTEYMYAEQICAKYLESNSDTLMFVHKRRRQYLFNTVHIYLGFAMARQT